MVISTIRAFISRSVEILEGFYILKELLLIDVYNLYIL